jgi:GntR family transcriptional repressor for pyruvate dehydrogenase complex
MSFSLAEKEGARDVPVRQPPSQEIVKRLLDELLSGSVAPGSRIPSERQLAEDLKVGRGMIREAIKSLSLLAFLSRGSVTERT